MELCLVYLTSKTAAMEGEVNRLVFSLHDQLITAEIAKMTGRTGTLEEVVTKLVSSLPDRQVREELAKVNSDITETRHN